MTLIRKTEIETHYQNIWNVKPVSQRFSAGPIHQLPIDFSVLKIPPTETRRDWIYATSCMSQERDTKLIELHLRSFSEDHSIVELLYAVAHFHRTSKNLDVGHTVNFGRPWINGAKCEYGLVSLPYIDGPELETLSLRNHATYFYWLIPVYKIEVDFKKTYGLELLEKKFDEVCLSYADINRVPVV